MLQITKLQGAAARSCRCWPYRWSPCSACVALAIDVGRLAVAQSECQNAADVAAITGVRTLTTGSGTNQTAATTNAQNAAIANLILGQTLAAAEIAVTHGAYHYNSTSQTFAPAFPPQSGDNYGLTQVVITHKLPGTFSTIFGITSMTVSATAAATYQPRDVAIVLDYSGSMNNESDVWNCESYLGSMENTPNDTNPVFPQFGPYKPDLLPQRHSAVHQQRQPRRHVQRHPVGGRVPGLGQRFLPEQLRRRRESRLHARLDHLQCPHGGRQLPPGQRHLRPHLERRRQPQLRVLSRIYQFQGLYPGAGLLGEDVLHLAPAADQRLAEAVLRAHQRHAAERQHPVMEQRRGLAKPGGQLHHQLQSHPQLDQEHRPQSLSVPVVRQHPLLQQHPQRRAGGGLQPRPAQQQHQRRGRRHHRSALLEGVHRLRHRRLARSQREHPEPGHAPRAAIGPDFTAGNGKALQITGPDYKYKSSYAAFIDPNDNPKRPRHRLWFGPMTMIQFMSDTGLFPGTTHDVSMVFAKLGINGALQDVQNNHPNDLVALCMFSRPPYQGDPTAVGQFPYARNNLGGNYTSMINSLWYPPNSGSADIRPWDANDLQAPAAHADYDSNTATDYGLMLAYNQLSCSTVLQGAAVGGQRVAAGGFGRKGAQKLIILETDGMVNQASAATFTNAGAYNSYYNLTPLGTVSASSAAADTSALNVATKISPWPRTTPTARAMPPRRCPW